MLFFLIFKVSYWSIRFFVYRLNENPVLSLLGCCAERMYYDKFFNEYLLCPH